MRENRIIGNKFRACCTELQTCTATQWLGNDPICQRRVVWRDGSRDGSRKGQRIAPQLSTGRAKIQTIKTGRASIPDSRCAAHIKCGGFSTFWPFRKTAICRLSLIRIRATSVDLRRACSAAKTVGVAAAHNIAAAKVRVAQKSYQLQPG